MDWNSRPYVYQLRHWWHWLSYGQNASVIQALAAVIAACAAIAAGIFAARAYKATLLQLRIARKQLRLAHRQFEVERSRYEEEKRAAAQIAKTVYERTVAEEDEVRPRFRSTNGYSQAPGLQSWTFKNDGSSAATALTVARADSHEALTQKQYVGAGHEFSIRVELQTFEGPGLLFCFRTAFGSTWRIILRLNTGEEVVIVGRPYAPVAVASDR